jgi:hypothetical protein
MVNALKDLLEILPARPMRIYSDLGSEFRNKLVEEFLENEDIHKLQASSPFNKASLAERAIRTLKQRLYRYFSQNKTLKWLDVIDNITNAINNSISRVHGIRPNDVTFENAKYVWRQIYGNGLSLKDRKKKPKFSIGESVRLSRGMKRLFEKEIMPPWSDHIFEIDEIKNLSNPIVYKIRNDKGQKLKDSYYGEELSKVRKEADTEDKIEQTFRKRLRKDGTYDVEIKYVGEPGKYWLHETELL